MKDFGVRWRTDRGDTFDSFGFTEKGARAIVARAGDRKTTSPRPVSVLVRETGEPRVLEASE